MEKNETVAYLKNASLVLIALTLLIFPLFFLTNSTDFFVLPKQILIVFSSIVLLILWGTRTLVERKITIRTTPFNLPIFLFGAVLLLSSLLSRNMFDSLLQSLPVISLLFFYFVAVNTIDDRGSFNIALSALSIGGVLSSLLSILYYFKLYFLPFTQIKTQYFTTFGSPIQHIAYLLPILILTTLYVYRRYRAGSLKEFTLDYSLMIHVVSSVIILAGIAVTLYKIVALPQKPIVLPFQYGFQIALASVAQDTARLLPSLLFGSGYGTFLTDFTRFHSAAFNLEQNLWNLTFSFSSSYVLEILATTGILGLIIFFFILWRTVKTRLSPLSPLFVAVISAFVLSFFVPFSFTLVVILFVMLAFYGTYLYLEGDKKVYDVVISLVALKRGLISFESEEEAPHSKQHASQVFPAVLLVLCVAIAGFLGYFGFNYVASDIKFAESLQQQTLANGQKTYDLQRAAIAQFPYKSDYYRIFSQVNLALANSLINSTPQGSSPSANTQQTVISLLQQSINSGRAAVTLAPMTATNWENLSSVYRSLIGVGQNAEQFAIASMNQAVILSPLDPRLRIALGGIYYQLGAFDQAQNQFQLAVNMKPDFANAYYNLGHTFESKKEYQNALKQYQIVRNLVANDKAGLEKIEGEIKALQENVGTQQTQNSQLPSPASSGEQQSLELNQPSQQFPPREDKVKISPPPTEDNPESTESAR